MAKKIIFLLLSLILFASCSTTKYVNPKIKDLNIERPQRPDIPSYDEMIVMEQEVLVKKIVIPILRYTLQIESIADDYENAYNSVKTEMNKNK